MSLGLYEEWEMNGQPPDVFIEDIKCKAKDYVAGVDKKLNELDKVVRSSRDWQRNILFSLCSDCRKKHYLSNTVSTKTDTRQPEKENEKGFFKNLLTGKKPTKAKKNDSCVDINGWMSSDEKSRLVEDFEYVLEAKESAFKNSSQRTESENKNLQEEIAKLREENELLKSKASSVTCDLKHTQEDKARVIAVLKGDQAAEMASRLKEFEANEKELKKQITDLTNKLVVKDRNFVELENDLRTSLNEFEATKKDLKEQITDLKNQLIEKDRKIVELENGLDAKDDELRNLKKELNEAKRPRVRDLVLGIRTERSGMGKTMIEMVTRELTRQLQNLLTKENISLTVKPCQSTADVPKGLLAVPCLTMSRVGTNIKDALTGIKVNRDVFVIVFHHTSKENLPSLTPTSLRITGSELRQLGAIIDMVFSSESGIYECDLNSTSVANIAALISKYS